MSVIDVAFEVGVGAWAVLVLTFLWSIERRLAELTAAAAAAAAEQDRERQGIGCTPASGYRRPPP